VQVDASLLAGTGWRDRQNENHSG